MILAETVNMLFDQVIEAINGISTEQYSRKNGLLNNATIGQHVRHIIELYLELLKGYDTGTIDYEKRERNISMEIDPAEACAALHRISNNLVKANKPLILISNYTEGFDEPAIANTNYVREIIYNIEHTIHHMALMRVAFEKVYQISLPDNFGVAPSTIKYRQTCVQ